MTHSPTLPNLARAAILVIGLGFVSASCSNSDLPDYFSLGSLRVLGIQADHPEVDPTASTSVTLTPVITARNAGTAAGTDPLVLTYVLEHCLDPGVTAGADPSCQDNPSRVSRTGTLTLASGNGAYTGTALHSGGALTLTVPTTIFNTSLHGAASAQDRYNGVPYLVTYRLSAPNGESTSAFRRIIATERTPLNQNPTITAIQKDGVTLTALPSTASDLTPLLGAGPAESYSVALSSGLSARTERITVSWFISQGELKRSRTDLGTSNLYTPASHPTGPVFMTAVVRDDRGGFGFLPATVGP